MEVDSLLSAEPEPSSTSNNHELSSEHDSISPVAPVLVTSGAHQPTKHALALRGGVARPSLASVGDAVRFNRDDSFNFGRMTVQGSVGFTAVANFAFGGSAGNWERIFDFGPFWGGSGQGMGFLLARVGTSNTLTSHLYPGGGRPGLSIDMPNQIRPNRQMTTVSTYQCVPAGVRFVRIQARRAYLQISFVSVQTADGTNVAFRKRAYASGSYPGTNPGKAVNGPAAARGHPNLWHATANLDWWEVDLGQQYAVTKIVVYNRADCCQDRMQDALVTTMDSSRNVINSVTLNRNAVQEFNFSPFVATYRLYMKDGTRNNQLWLVNSVSAANVPCASATFDNTYVGRSNWGHDALLTGSMRYFSFTNGVQSYGDLATLAAQVQENPQNAPGNWMKSSAVMVPGYSTFADIFVNPPTTRATLAPPALMYTRPVVFNRNNQNYLDFGRTVADPNQGISFIVSFAFTGNQPGSWERVFDFGSGPGTGNFVLARKGTSNDLIFLSNVGGGFDSPVTVPNVIRPGKLLVVVGTHLKGLSKLYIDGRLVGQHTGRQQPGLRAFSQSFLGRSNWGHDAFFNGQIFYFQTTNTVVSEPHQRSIYNRLKRASNSVIGYIVAAKTAAAPPPVVAVDLRDAALPCGNNLLANEGLTNEEGTARLILQSDGNLVLYNKNGKALWSSGTAGNAGDRLEVQTDGNLVVYNGNAVKWASHSNGRPKGCELVVQDDCNLVLYKYAANGAYGKDNALGNFKASDAMWNSRTSGRCNEPLFN